ncbi:uncharacterized protein LOC127039769 [Gopherus flavomarginatus]|uniref:uncharacterized protein LOC127039769 n=1 Tax=Gopherus flavomarginatus TaxID=286002 RepID=UPI0021CBA0F7|nr:uncharacterized protein LOC127039769 [Gopherus flavomarginatus]
MTGPCTNSPRPTPEPAASPHRRQIPVQTARAPPQSQPHLRTGDESLYKQPAPHPRASRISAQTTGPCTNSPCPTPEPAASPYRRQVPVQTARAPPQSQPHLRTDDGSLYKQPAPHPRASRISAQTTGPCTNSPRPTPEPAASPHRRRVPVQTARAPPQSQLHLRTDDDGSLYKQPAPHPRASRISAPATDPCTNSTRPTPEPAASPHRRRIPVQTARAPPQSQLHLRTDDESLYKQPAPHPRASRMSAPATDPCTNSLRPTPEPAASPHRRQIPVQTACAPPQSQPHLRTGDGSLYKQHAPHPRASRISAQTTGPCTNSPHPTPEPAASPHRRQIPVQTACAPPQSQPHLRTDNRSLYKQPAPHPRASRISAQTTDPCTNSLRPTPEPAASPHRRRVPVQTDPPHSRASRISQTQH